MQKTGPLPLEVSLIILPIKGRIWRYNRTMRLQSGQCFKAGVYKLTSKLDRVREWSEGGKAELKAIIIYPRPRKD